MAELVTAAPEAYDPAPALSAPCSEPCPETCSAPAAETAELAEETLTTAVMPESPVMADSLTHGQRVAAIAATLFQDLAELHGLDDVWGTGSTSRRSCTTSGSPKAARGIIKSVCASLRKISA